MPRIFIISLFLRIAVTGAAQNADSLLYFEQRAFYAADTLEKNKWLLAKFKFHVASGSDGAVAAAKRVNWSILPDGRETRAQLWNAALLSYLQQEDILASSLLAQYNRFSNDTSVSYKFLLLLINRHGTGDTFQNLLKDLIAADTIFENVQCLNQVIVYQRRHKQLTVLSSAIVPGSGMFMSGYPLKAVTALALCGGSAAGIITLVQYGCYINAVLWGTGVGLKFYTGNIILTEKLFERRELRQKRKLATMCELKLEKVLKKYPLNLRD